jgi:tetratricopeptide (TPR) repeat protein
MRLALLLTVLPGLTLAQECPESPDIAAERDHLLSILATTTSPAEARPIADSLWILWRTAPDEHSQELLDRGIARREAYDLEDSEGILDELIDYCPDYAEGYNQRAFTRFLRQDYESSLEDLEHVLETEPHHFGALSGKAVVFLSMGRMILGQSSLREALEVHPWLNERVMLQPDNSTDL